jgi:hypothetical protein
MYDPRRPSSEQHRIDWKASDELAQAVAVAQLALAMARDSQTALPVTKDNKTPDKPDVLLAASRHLKNWMAESKEQGLPEGMVISLIHFRQAKENTKGNKPKVKAGVSR